VSVEASGKGFRVRWRGTNGENCARGGFATEAAAERFDRRVKDLKASGELWRLDEKPRGEMLLDAFIAEKWMPFMKDELSPDGLMNYTTQIDLRISPRWGRYKLRDIETGPLEEWGKKLSRDGVGDATVIKTMTVLRSIMDRAIKHKEVATNPVKDIKQPSRRRKRQPLRITPLEVELIRADLLHERQRYTRTKKGTLKRIPMRDPFLRLRDATLVSVLAYSGPRPESEAVTLRWGQIMQRIIKYEATKSGEIVERATRLQVALARDLTTYKLATPRSAPDDLLFPAGNGGKTDVWGGSDWDNWRDRTFRPACVESGLPWDARPRDLRGSYATLLIYEGMNATEVAKQLGNSAATVQRDYGDVFENFDPADRRPAEDVIREARQRVASTPRATLITELRGDDVSDLYLDAQEGAE
jgi:site-specific recombinase XerD